MSQGYNTVILFNSPPTKGRLSEIETGIASWLNGSSLCQADEHDLIMDGNYIYDLENNYIPSRDPDLPPQINPLLFGVSMNHLRYSMDLFNLEITGSDSYSLVDLEKLRGLLLWLITQEDIKSVYYSSESSWARPLKLSDLTLSPEKSEVEL